jgi:antitoxin component of RelBE/YafQ-DinJ toxin-antitoxin module
MGEQRNVMIRIDGSLYEEAKKLLKEDINLSVSKFIEITLRQLVRSRTTPMADAFGNMVEDLLSSTAKKPVRRKRRQ